MTRKLQEYEDWLNRKWTRREIHKINARIRATRRRVWVKRHETLIAGIIALAVAALAFGIVLRMN